MPRVHRLHFLVFVLSCSVFLGCKDEPKPVAVKPAAPPPHPLVGTWSLLARSTNSIPATELQTITNTLGWMEFKSDNTYTSVFAFGPEELRRGGKYKEIYNSLTLRNGTNAVETHSIKIEGDQLLFVTPQESNNVVYTYLKRLSP